MNLHKLKLGSDETNATNQKSWGLSKMHTRSIYRSKYNELPGAAHRSPAQMEIRMEERGRGRSQQVEKLANKQLTLFDAFKSRDSRSDSETSRNKLSVISY